MSPVAHDLRTTTRLLLEWERKTCGLEKQLQPSSGQLRRPECAVELESAWICVEVDLRRERALWSTQLELGLDRITGVEGVRLACRLQVE